MLLEPGKLLDWIYHLDVMYSLNHLTCPECHNLIDATRERHHHAKHCLLWELIEHRITESRQAASCSKDYPGIAHSIW